MLSRMTSAALVAGIVFAFGTSYGAEGDQKAMNHLRHAKADIFEKMASCLKSERSEANCEQELRENCEKMGGMKQCGMASVDSTPAKGKKMARKTDAGKADSGGSMGGMGGGGMGHDKMMGGMGGGMGNPGGNAPAQDPMPDKGMGTDKGAMPPMEPGDM